MPRPLRTPDLPTTPGEWLACYRYRITHEDGQHWSPEDLAGKLGVSGDTVRRWESGKANPTASDLNRFACIAMLRPIEHSFLLTAFSAIDIEEAPQPELFRSLAKNLLSEPFPAYLYDSLFNVRAWNSYMDVVHELPFEASGTNRMMRMFEPLPPGSRAHMTVENRRENWLREFWYETARLCGSSAYSRTLKCLTESPEFAARWIALGLEYAPSQEKPVGAPNFRVDPERGTFRASTSTIGLPPTYYRREFIPVDMLAWQGLEDRKARGTPEVMFARYIHWSEEH